MSNLIDKNLLPTEDEIRLFNQNGFYFSKVLFTEDELDQAIQAQDRFYKEGGIWPSDKRKPKGWEPGDPSELRQNDYACFQIPELMEFIKKPILGAVAAHLIQESVRLWNEHISYKEAGDVNGKSVRGWHNDRKYWLSCSSLNMVSAWIPLTDVDESMGTVNYISGSNHWTGNEHLDYFTTDLDFLEKQIQNNGQEIKKVPANLKRGQVAFHHCMTIHGSAPNTSNRPRRAVGVHMQPVSNQPVKNHFHFNKILANRDGEIRYDDPFWFPLLGTYQKE